MLLSEEDPFLFCDLELFLIEKTIYRIDPRTSNRALGQLKKRSDLTGIMARAEIKRREKQKPPSKTQIYDALRKRRTSKVAPHIKDANPANVARAVRKGIEDLK